MDKMMLVGIRKFFMRLCWATASIFKILIDDFLRSVLLFTCVLSHSVVLCCRGFAAVARYAYSVVVP